MIQVENEKIFNCPNCKSNNTVRYGNRKTKSGLKSKRKCKNCDAVFTNQSPRCKKKKNTLETILLAVRISKTHSLRETEHILQTEHNIKITYAAISVWKKEFSDISKMEKDDDWMYKSILNTNTHTDYDNNRINEEWMED